MEVLEVQYGDVVANPLTHAGWVNKFLGGALAVALMADAVDEKLHRQRR